MIRIREIFIFSTLAGLASSPAFASVDKQIAFWKTFNEKLDAANKNSEKKKLPNQNIYPFAHNDDETFKNFLSDEACAESKGFRADGGLLCFNPKIRQIATYYCKEVAQKQNWEKTKCATAEKSFWRKIIKGILGDIKKIKDIHTTYVTGGSSIDDKYFNNDFLAYHFLSQIKEYKEEIIKAMKYLDQTLSFKKLEESEVIDKNKLEESGVIDKNSFCDSSEKTTKIIEIFCTNLYNNKLFDGNFITDFIAHVPEKKDLDNYNVNESKDSDYDNVLIVESNPFMKEFVDFLCKGVTWEKNISQSSNPLVEEKQTKIKKIYEYLKFSQSENMQYYKENLPNISSLQALGGEQKTEGAVATIEKLCPVSKE